MSSLPLDLLRGNGGFTLDPRFRALASSSAAAAGEAEVDVEAEAYRRGFADGTAQAMQAALEAERERDARREAIELAFARFDEASAVALRERLRQTVLALCEEAVVPLAIDPEGLALRIDKATAMLQRSRRAGNTSCGMSSLMNRTSVPPCGGSVSRCASSAP